MHWATKGTDETGMLPVYEFRSVILAAGHPSPQISKETPTVAGPWPGQVPCRMKRIIPNALYPPLRHMAPSKTSPRQHRSMTSPEAVEKLHPAAFG